MTASASVPGAGTYRLVNAANGTCLEVPAAAAKNGVRLGGAKCAAGNAAQRTWRLSKSGNGFLVKSALSGLCTGVQGASTSAGKAVQQQLCNGTSAQVWKLSAVGDAFHLVNAKSGKCLNVKAGLAQQNSCDKALNKSWKLEAVTGPVTRPAPTPPASLSPSPSTSVSPAAAPTKTPAATPTRTPAASNSAPAPSAGGALGAWPTPTGDKPVTSTIKVSTSLDGGMKRFIGSGALGSDSQDEDQDPIFELADGATLENVILGDPAADGVHCLGSCTLRNVWWQDVGEDAATFKGSSAAATYVVDGGGARKADDKVFQFNGQGNLTVKNFQVEDFGKLVRMCGNCRTQHQRHAVISNVKVTSPGKVLVGVNANYGDTVTISGVTVVGDSARRITICERFKGNNTGAEPSALGTGPDGTNCLYSASDITYK